MGHVFEKISVLFGVDEKGNKEITISSPAPPFGKPVWSVSLTPPEAGDLAFAILRDIRDPRAKK